MSVTPSDACVDQVDALRDVAQNHLLQVTALLAMEAPVPHSQVETFVALHLHIDTWCRAGVPFYIRSGKRMPVTSCEVVATLRRPPLAMFDAVTGRQANYLRFRLSPEVTISRGARVKRAGEQMQGEPVELVARHPSPQEELSRQWLPGEAIRGDPSLFTGDACVEAAWVVVDPVPATRSACMPTRPAAGAQRLRTP